ncbi:GntR family transcriptional regulator [Streptomyces althioticus]|uniref:GntR family transcriptional regulator n=1 Tax=Streptomyces althioticus TaxID=83380 RepID=UPI0033EE15ED
MPSGYKEIADDIDRRIRNEEWGDGKLPSVRALQDEYDTTKVTVRRALAELEDRGSIVLHDRSRARIRTRTPIRVPLSRYGRVMAPGGDKGPWETACADLGLDGRMQPVEVVKEPAPADVAAALGIDASARVVRRTRFALVGEEVVQLQDAFYDAMFAAQTGLDSPDKIVGGVYGALTALGLAPTEADERVSGGLPTPRECEVLHIGSGVPVLRLERVTRSGDRLLEVLRVSVPVDRVEFVYDGLPLGGERPGS